MTTSEQDKVANAIANLVNLVESELLDVSKSFADYFQTLVKENRTAELPEAINIFAQQLERGKDIHEVITYLNKSRFSDYADLRNALARNKWEASNQLADRVWDTYLAHLG